ncbi:OEP6 [Hirschfeldia incana]|nr:OEP6 [Hirschfeldia incana]
MDKAPEIHFPKLDKSSGKKQTATAVVGALAVAWLAVEFVFKPLLSKLNSSKDKSVSEDATAPPAADADTAAPASEDAAAPSTSDA